MKARAFQNQFIESLFVSAMVLERHMDASLRAQEFSGMSQLKILIAIDRTHLCSQGKDCTQSLIAHALGVSEAAISRQILNLEKDKLVIRGHDPSEKRRVLLKLTAKGRKSMLKSMSILDKELKRVLKPLSRTVEAQLVTNLKKVLEALSKNTHHYEINSINNKK